MMVYDPANVAEGFLSGIDASQMQRGRKMNMDIAQEGINTRAAKARKTKNLGGYLQDFMAGDPDAAGKLAGGGVEGVGMLKTGQDYLQGQQKQKAAQTKANQEKAGQEFASAIPFSMNVTDEQEWDTQAFPYLADKFVQAGGDPALVRQLDALPMGEAQRVIREMTGGEEAKRLPTSGIINVKMADGTPNSFDVTTQEGRDDYQEAVRAGATEEKAVTKTQEVPVESFIGSKTDFSKFKQQEVATKNALSAFGKVVETVKETPDAGMSGGKISAVFAGAKDEIMSAATTLGYEIKSEDLDIANYSKELAVVDDIYRGQAFDAALAYAGAFGLGEGRALTDTDVKRALNRIGKNWGTSKKSRLGIMQDLGDSLLKRHKNSYESWHTDKYKGDIGKEFMGLFGEKKSEYTKGERVTQGGNTFEWDGEKMVYVE